MSHVFEDNRTRDAATVRVRKSQFADARISFEKA